MTGGAASAGDRESPDAEVTDPADATGGDGTAPAELRTARRLSRLLDEAVAVPGTSVRVGLDPILGLVPGLGDAAATLLGLTVVLLGARAGLAPATLARMLATLLVDAALGSVPLVGDLFDAGFRANSRNVALFERRVREGGARRDGLALLSVALGAVVGLLAALAAVLLALGWLLLELTALV